ncbi:MAG TPA: hypothetical protein PKW51_04720 [Methanoregulaceae archaeon]|nr:hypothetical protein [Methanoregulaceae archaeon]
MIKFYEQELQIEEAVEYWETVTVKRGAAPESARPRVIGGAAWCGSALPCHPGVR